MFELSADHARRFLVARHLLAPPRALAADPASVLEVIGRLGSLQFDPLEVPGARNHELVLFARIAGYQKGWCERWLYGPPGERRLFEAYNKSLNIVPLADLPYQRWAWRRAHERYRERIFERQAHVVARIFERLGGEGPLSSNDFNAEFGGPIDWHWAPTSQGRAVVEALFESGLVALARREGNRRWFDRSERLLAGEHFARDASAEQALRHRLLSRHRGVGLMGESAGAELLHGTGTAAERRASLAALLDAGELVPAKVEGLRGVRYLLAGELDLARSLARPDPARAPAEASLLAPLDPLVWDRRLLRDLFGFAYTWEVYTPLAKRRFGYYVLPLLFGDAFVGRIEPRLERATGTLHVLGLWFEDGFRPLETPGFAAALGRALDAYARFVGATKVLWPRGKVASALKRAAGEAAAPAARKPAATKVPAPAARRPAANKASVPAARKPAATQAPAPAPRPSRAQAPLRAGSPGASAPSTRRAAKGGWAAAEARKRPGETPRSRLKARLKANSES
ncbi:MAG TPA: crosslink repair DNA glycosylase YcaQ family protein [Polyangiaceae bacterium]|nr:crosslink repair DNA glycosylase YcaQ family protein [Polyangiaceae bacterium]